MGLASCHIDLNQVPLGQDERSWVLRGDGGVFHADRKLYQVPALQEGDVIGIAFDHISLRFLLNGEDVGCCVNGVRQVDESGVFAVLFVDDGAVLDAAFHNFIHDPPIGYSRIMVEQTLLLQQPEL